ncbi:MAG TPA: tryptophan-rich sensory protein [Leptolyngbyaceae cyanobacterium M65_K2018_010]|nr:tryptophan-rich sensory protein [Leptolyngbyaceae cyanobacterium M65_K2018_010]
MDTSPSSARSGLGLAIATVIAIAATIVINTLSNLFPPGGQNVGEIANTQLAGVLITPANYAFVIWGAIYLGLIAYGLYQFHPGRRRQANIQRVNRLLIVACGAQVIWIFLFTLQRFGWSVLAMAGILLPLIGIYLTLQIGRRRVPRRQRWMAHIPFSLYLGWIAVATIVNVASALYARGWAEWGLDPVSWTAIMIVVAERRDVTFTLVFIWAFGAIALRHSTIPAIWGTATIASIVLLLWLGWVRGFRPRP